MKERTRAVRVKASFFEPMLCLAVPKIPKGPEWQYELKLDGYRAIGVRSKRGAELWSRNEKDFSRRFANVTRALKSLPEDTVVDGEVVAVDEAGRPCFNLLQNFESSGQTVLFYVFDLLLLGGGGPHCTSLRLAIQKTAGFAIKSGAIMAEKVEEALARLNDPAFATMSAITMAVWGRRPLDGCEGG